MTDPVASRLKGHCAPQTCWSDDSRAFSLNEVAINWNAPLVWVSAWASEQGRKMRPQDGPEIAITIDDLPLHGPLPPGETALDVAQRTLAALQAAHVEAYGFVNGQ
jgi:hypothetical protein